jgi:HEAT repeat protein
MRNLGLLAVAAVAVLCGSNAAAGDAEMLRLFSNATGVRGKEYLKLRNQITARGTAATAFLEARRAKATTWQGRLLADVLLEHIQNQDSIRSATSDELSFELRRSKTDRIRAAGKSLADRFAPFPLVLVEFLWKGNELSEISLHGSDLRPLKNAEEADAYAARALGLLGERRALPILLVSLERSNRYLARLTAGEAIGMIGSPEVLPDLLRIAESAADSNTRAAAVNAIPRCASTETVGLLRTAAEETSRPSLRRLLMMVAADIETTGRPGGSEAERPPTVIQEARPKDPSQLGDQGAAASRVSKTAGMFWVGLMVGVVVGAALSAAVAVTVRRMAGHRS